ncbi:hypothetical protein AGOR_G00181330 [Albula goreensis]|uniref:Uncharacterized protein n=1 Tax=Albula goreensis TaxID=1534307 RepID=A0A8T3CWR9_9TELE|nr:hypothetical protein AGOR_G00181330 [Albula goreensis]
MEGAVLLCKLDESSKSYRSSGLVCFGSSSREHRITLAAGGQKEHRGSREDKHRNWNETISVFSAIARAKVSLQKSCMQPDPGAPETTPITAALWNSDTVSAVRTPHSLHRCTVSLRKTGEMIMSLLDLSCPFLVLAVEAEKGRGCGRGSS